MVLFQIPKDEIIYPPMFKDKQTASDVLEGVVQNTIADTISFQEITAALHERGFGLLMMVFAIPVSLPLPVPPGLTTLPAIPLLFFSVQMIMERDAPWLPAWIGRKQIKRSTLAVMVEKSSPYLRRVERLLRPRLTFFTSPMGERIVGVFSLIFAICVANPVPLTHLIPAIGILLMSLGLISKDGVPVIIGMLVGSLGVIISVIATVLGEKALIALFSGFSGLM